MMRGKAHAAPMASRRKQPSAIAPLPAPLPAPPRLDAGARGEPRWSALLGEHLPLAFSAINAGHAEIGLAIVVLARRCGASLVCAHFVVDLLACGLTECYGEAFDA